MKQAHLERCLPHLSRWDARLGDRQGISALCWLPSAGEAFWKLKPSSMAASPGAFFLWPEPYPKSPASICIHAAQGFRRGGSVEQMPSPQLGWARPASCLHFGLQKAWAAESLPGCRVQGPGSMTGSISYFNAELGTQSLLKINTKENPKVAKPISIPFIFLVPGSFVFPLQVWRRISHRAHPECSQGSHPSPRETQPKLDHQ